jgi:hypothetical protein
VFFSLFLFSAFLIGFQENASAWCSDKDGDGYYSASNEADWLSFYNKKKNDPKPVSFSPGNIHKVAKHIVCQRNTSFFRPDNYLKS